MSTSFTVTRRFFDDKNYPRGFARHGDYTIKEAQILEQYGQAFRALDLAEREPQTEEEIAFVAVCRGEREAQTPFEKAWQKYRNCINASKRIYTLSADVSAESSSSDDFTGE